MENRLCEAIKGADILDKSVLNNLKPLDDGLLVPKLILMYKDSFDVCEQKLIESFKAKDVGQLREAAHRLKGSSNNIGMNKVGLFFEQMEIFAKNCTEGDEAPTSIPWEELAPSLEEASLLVKEGLLAVEEYIKLTEEDVSEEPAA